MALFSKVTTTASALEAARIKLEKAAANENDLTGKSRAAEELRVATNDRLNQDREAGASPEVLAKDREDNQRAIDVAYAAEVARSRAASTTKRLRDEYEDAVAADVKFNYGEAGKKLRDRLFDAAAAQAELLEIADKAPKGLRLPLLAMPFLAPGALNLWNAELDAFISGPKPAPKLAAGLRLVKIIKQPPMNHFFNTNACYVPGEVVGMAADLAAKLIEGRYAVAV